MSVSASEHPGSERAALCNGRSAREASRSFLNAAAKRDALLAWRVFLGAGDGLSPAAQAVEVHPGKASAMVEEARGFGPGLANHAPQRDVGESRLSLQPIANAPADFAN